ncbi:MAG: zinc dependent phospholipase C family protein [Saprospiraceae bacterium]
MKTKICTTLILELVSLSTFVFSAAPPELWGFFAHKKINRLAVFTLPVEMAGFYKKHLDFIEEHAVDPDKRRYSSKFEAPRHYIDLDAYGEAPFSELPRNWLDALIKYSEIFAVNRQSDTLLLFDPHLTIQTRSEMLFTGGQMNEILCRDTLFSDKKLFKDFFYRNIINRLYEEDLIAIPIDSLKNVCTLSADITSVIAKEHLTQHGIVPYHLSHMEKRLTEAFRDKNSKRILQLSAEIGHYLGDAHVPLHTTRNYNGQLSGQRGIHAFWESRIPELLSEDYDYWVGSAEFIPNTSETFWQIVFDSHKLVDSLLQIEKKLSLSYPSDQIFCLEERQGTTIKTQCESYVRAYSARLNGQVEDRMRAAILSIGSIWFTAWVNAGQPDLNQLDQEEKELNSPLDKLPDAESKAAQSMIGRPEN